MEALFDTLFIWRDLHIRRYQALIIGTDDNITENGGADKDLDCNPEEVVQVFKRRERKMR